MFWKRNKQEEVTIKKGFHVHIVFLHLIEEHWDEDAFEVSMSQGLETLRRRLKEPDAPSPEDAWDQVVSFFRQDPTKDGMQLRVTRGGHPPTRTYSVTLCEGGVRFACRLN